MAKYTNSFGTKDAKGNREALSDFIGRVDKKQFSFLGWVEHETETSPLFQWQMDSAADSEPTPLPEGFSFEAKASKPTIMLQNVTTILSENAVVTRNQMKVKRAGRPNELAYQIDDKAITLKNNVEKMALRSQAYSNGTERVTRGLAHWLSANPASSHGTGYVGPANYAAGETAITNATANRSFTENLLLDVLQALASAGATPDTILLPPYLKRKLSGFAGRSNTRIAVDADTIMQGADIYDSDFGLLRCRMNVNMRPTDAFVLTSKLVKLRFIDKFTVRTPSTAFDGEGREIVADVGLEVSSPAASAVITDLISSATGE